MGRSSTAGGKKVKISLTLDPDLLAWAQAHSGPGEVFATVSHAVERGLRLLKEGFDIQGTHAGETPAERTGAPARSRSSTTKK